VFITKFGVEDSIDMASDQMTISRFSLMTRLSQKALRLYDQKGLLVPTIKDFVTGYRYYSIKQIEQGLTIKYLASLGFTLAEIASIFKAASSNQSNIVHNLFNEKLSEVKTEIQRLQRIEALLNGTTGLDSLFPHTTEPIVKEIPKIRVISKRTFGTYAGTIPQLINTLMGQITRKENRNNFVTVTGPIMFISRDDEYKEENADIEIAIPVTGRIIVDEGIEIKVLEGGRFVSTIYTGSYAGIGEGHDCVSHYCIKHGFVDQGPTREIYLVGPQDKPPNELKTEIQLGLK
jgi:DNA-binding transcriptional MerR regulator